jgi:hypothetical protein
MSSVLVFLNRLMSLLTRLFFGVVGLGVAGIFLMMGLSLIFHGSGSPGFRALVHSDGFFPWPVATLFYLGGFAPIMMGVAVVGWIVRSVLRGLLLVKAEPSTARVLTIRPTGTRVNGNPVMLMHLSVDRTNAPPSDTKVKAVIGPGSMPRVGDRVQVRISRVDPTYVAYKGL